MKAVMIAATLSLTLIKPAAAINLSKTLWGTIGSEVGVDPVLAYAVGLVETTRSSGGYVTPWPWTIRSSDGAVFADNRKQAELALTRALASSRNIDVGAMQVNVGHHSHRVTAPSDLLDPAVQLRVGMTILREAIASAPHDL